MASYSKEVENAKVEIVNEITVSMVSTTIQKLQDWYATGKLIVLPKWLQRKLREFDWYKDDYLNGKQFIASVWKNTNCFDSFSVLDLEKLVTIVEDKLRVEQNTDKLKELGKLFDYLNSYKAKGAIYVSMDGQSRLILGIHQYMTDKFSLDKCGTFVDLRLDGKQSNLLITTKFTELPINVANSFREKKVPLNIVRDFADLDDVTEALVNKQKGFEWTWFQKLKQSRRWSLFYISLDEIMQKNSNFENKYETHMKVSDDLKFDVDGHELYLVNMAYMIQYGHWPDKKEFPALFTDDKKISETSYKTVIDYSNEFFEALGNVKTSTTGKKSKSKKDKVLKVGIAPLINYVLFRQVMDGKIGTSKFAKQITLGSYFQMKNPAKFVDAFMKNHVKFTIDEIKHPISYIYNDTTSKWDSNKEGYKQNDTFLFKQDSDVYDDFYANIYDFLVFNNLKNNYEIFTS